MTNHTTTRTARLYCVVSRVLPATVFVLAATQVGPRFF
jgi:hypothetical protein